MVKSERLTMLEDDAGHSTLQIRTAIGSGEKGGGFRTTTIQVLAAAHKDGHPFVDEKEEAAAVTAPSSAAWTSAHVPTTIGVPVQGVTSRHTRLQECC